MNRIVIKPTTNTKHLYEINATDKKTNEKIKLEVYANNAGQANHRATRAGYIVHDVNMVG